MSDDLLALEDLELAELELDEAEFAEFALDAEDDPNSEKTQHHFSLLETLGEGAMGKVVLAQDKDLLRKVAIKKIKNQVSQNQFLLDSFVTEAQITAQLEHPCIIPIYGLEVNQAGEMAYSMKRIEGQTLTELIQSAKKQYDTQGKADEEHDLNAFLEHFLKVADAVEYAHQKGIIHRDLKPDNIMIGPYNEVYILDWGIARPMTEPPDNLAPETRVQLAKTAKDFNDFEVSDVYGTPCYMSPEQAAGGNEFLNGQSDLYSLGLILFELVSLKSAYTEDQDYNQTIDNSIFGKINPLSPYHPNMILPRELAAIIRKATQLKRKERYQSVKDMSDEIRRYLRGEAVLAEPDTPIQKLQRWISQNKEKTLVLILSITLLSASIIAWSFYKRHSDNLIAQQREAAQAQFLNLMRDKSQQINVQFLEIAGLTQNLGSAMEQMIESNEAKEHDYYTFQMAQEGQLAPDSMPSKTYQSLPVSLDHLSFKIAPDVPLNQVEKPIKRIAGYAPYMKRLFLLSSGDNTLDPDSQVAENIMRNQGVAVSNIYVGFEEGFGFLYPFNTINPNYDFRQRPWYKSSKGTAGYRWGQPYLDSAGMGWVLPCTKALYDSNKRFRGVVGMDILLNHIKDAMLIPQNDYVKDVYLLDAKGQILIQGSEKRQDFKAGTLINEVEALKSFYQDDIVKEIQAKTPSGYLQTEGSQPMVYSYQRLSSTDWTYLVEVDAQKLFARK